MWTCNPASEQLFSTDTAHGNCPGSQSWFHTCMAVDPDRIILYKKYRGSSDQSWNHLLLFAVIFQLVTLPVEFNASARALRILGEQGILSDSELPYTKKVLKAAALTYVASAAAAILQLLRLVLLFGGRDRD